MENFSVNGQHLFLGGKLDQENEILLIPGLLRNNKTKVVLLKNSNHI